MITKEQIEKIIEESYSNYPKFLSSTIEKIEIRFKSYTLYLNPYRCSVFVLE